MPTGKTRRFKALTFAVTLLMMTLGLTPVGFAEIVSSETIISELAPATDTDIIEQTMANAEVQAKLQQLGFTPEEVQTRLDRLTPEQRQQLATQLQEAQVASGAILSAAAINLIVYVITPLIAAFLIYLVQTSEAN